MQPAEQRSVSLELTYDEALVLFEWMHRHEDENYSGQFFLDKAERVAVYSLTASLEPLIDEVFSSNYGDVIEAAKTRLAHEE
jgi:hypothetical protein